MFNRFLFSVGLVSFMLCIISLFILIPLLRTPPHTSGKIPLSQPTVCGGGCGGEFAFLISQSTLSFDMEVEYEWPKHMDINGSESISVALTVPTPPIPSIPNPTPTPVGDVTDRGVNSLRPDRLNAEAATDCAQENITDPRLCQISNIFGKGYKMSTASAYMVTTSFDTQLMGPSERSVDQPLIEWDWNIFPKSVGSQVITLGIDLQWTPTGKSGGATILRQLWESPLTIEVDQPFLNAGQLSLSSVITGVFGTVFTGVSLTWFLEQRQQKSKQNKKKIKYCQTCKAVNPEDFKYCNQCGKQRMALPSTTIPAQPGSLSPDGSEKTHAPDRNVAEAQQASVQISSQGNGK